MPHLSRSLLLLAAGLVSCSAPPQQGAALRISIELEAGLRSTCVLLEVRDSGSGELLRASTGARIQGRVGLSAAVFRDDLPERVTLQAIGFSDVGCTTRTTPAEASEAEEEAFPTAGVKDIKRTVTRTVTMSIDVDNDGAPAESDCDDRDPARRPGLPEICTDGKDNDCNDLVDCADSACGAVQCRLAGSVCAAGVCTETVCSNGSDDDGDGQVDCADGDCAGKACAQGGTCSAGACRGAMSEQGLCDDGADNDGDGQTDCADADCNQQPCSDGLGCTRGETCTGGACGGGAQVTCGAPATSCSAPTGECREPDGGCFFAPAGDAGCDDGRQCTIDDRCDGDGGCAGVEKVCLAPPAGPCWEASGTCDEARDGGCVYDVAVGRLSCSDADDCTLNDACLEDGGCLGAPLDCLNAQPPDECQVATGGACANGACPFMQRTGSCDGGTCVAGACVPEVPDAGPMDPDAGSSDAGASDGGAAADAGAALDGGAVDAGPTFVQPSNVTLATINGATSLAHFNVICSSIINLNPVGIQATGLCAAPTLPAPVLVPQTNGPTLVVFVMDRLTIAQGVTLRVNRGSAGNPADRAPVFAVKGDAVISGTLDVSPQDGFIGANYVLESGVGGQGPFCPSATNGSGSGSRSGGGQGGAFGDGSGSGGRGADNGGQGAPGLAANGNDTLVPLRGGCAGSRGGNGAAIRYGRAGGAVQLWVRGQLQVGGAILASGGRGLSAQAEGGGGGGGGSGGGLLVEATSLSLTSTAIIAANGGSGAEGSSYGWGNNGQNGTAGVSTASGGTGANYCGGFGGRGGARNGASTNGQTGGLDGNCNVANLGGGGGGGGSVGRVRINTLNPCSIASGARISPQATSAQATCRP